MEKWGQETKHLKFSREKKRTPATTILFSLKLSTFNAETIIFCLILGRCCCCCYYDWAEFRNIMILFGSLWLSVLKSRRWLTVLCVWLYVLQMNNWTNSIWYYQYNVSVSMLLPQKYAHTLTEQTQTCTRCDSIKWNTFTCTQTPPKHTNARTHSHSSHTPMTHIHTFP